MYSLPIFYIIFLHFEVLKTENQNITIGTTNISVIETQINVNETEEEDLNLDDEIFTRRIQNGIAALSSTVPFFVSYFIGYSLHAIYVLVSHLHDYRP